MRLSRRMRRDHLQVITEGTGVYDTTTGETAPGPDTILWDGYGSVQVKIRSTSEGIAEVRGGIQMDINAAYVFLPWDALTLGQAGYRVENVDTGKSYKPMREAFDMGGQHQMWMIECGLPR